MAGKKRRRLKLLTLSFKEDTRISKQGDTEQDEQEAWSFLPVELLEFIISQLTLKDNIRTSAVCKTWFSVALSVRVVNKPPWLMYFPKLGNRYEFYDPSKRKTYSLELPELRGCRICYNKDGWLLLYKPRTQRVLFFNPFTREMIKLPRFEMTYQIVAFSSSPKSPNCIVFTVKHVSPTVVAISTCYPGATVWTTVNYHNRLPFVSSIWNKLVFCNGLFYCLSLTGWLGVYDPNELTWTIRVVPPPRCPDNFFVKNWWKGKFMAEHKGDIYVIYTCYSENPVNTAPTVIILISDDDVDGGFATAITDALQPNPTSPFKTFKESFDLPLDRYGITDIKASGHITHFVDATGIKQVSILVLQKYEPPILACAVNEVLSSLAGEDTSTMPTLVFPFLVDSSKLKLERQKSPGQDIYGIQIGPQTNMIQALASRHVKAPSSMQIFHEPLSCVLQFVRVLKTASFILIGQCGQHKTRVDDFEIICEIGESLASATSMQFVKEKVTWNPTKVSKEQEKEPWRALYG